MMRLGLPLLVLVATLGAACEEKKPSTESARADSGAGTDKYATADPKLANALQAAASDSGRADHGPPPDGIFAAGQADGRHPQGSPTTVDVVADGSEPRVALSAPAGDAAFDARPSTYGRAALETAVQMGPRNVIVLDFGLSIGAAKKDEGGPGWLVADVKTAVPAERQMGQLPPGTDKDVASLAGTSMRIKLTADGRESELQVQPGKSTRPELERLAMNAAEALVLATVPLPARPVGVGAQWIAETRMPLSGLDVIAYRAYRVKEIDGDRISLTLEVKAYAASKDVTLQGVPKGANLVQFDAESEGQLEL